MGVIDVLMGMLKPNASENAMAQQVLGLNPQGALRNVTERNQLQNQMMQELGLPAPNPQSSVGPQSSINVADILAQRSQAAQDMAGSMIPSVRLQGQLQQLTNPMNFGAGSLSLRGRVPINPATVGMPMPPPTVMGQQGAGAIRTTQLTKPIIDRVERLRKALISHEDEGKKFFTKQSVNEEIIPGILKSDDLLKELSDYEAIFGIGGR